MVYLYTDYFYVEYYATTGVLMSQWHGKCSSLQYRQSLIQYLRICKDLNLRLAVTDRRLQQALTAEDMEWMQTHFINAFINLPLERLAIIRSFDPVAESQFQQLYQNNGHPFPFESRSFEDLTSAYNWITA
ncbi:hypothetical protein [Pontibacter vulgaris]|uniref:hypothetical protein n=1 Tax=Pontibacter vulgaris TaxID=2905679 RepID=UPI001FA7376F|nr:hypothetical protein [Pontibacter vulgaris]